MENKKNFAWPVTSTYSSTVSVLRDCLKNNASIFRSRGITIFGAGIRGCEYMAMIDESDFSVVQFIDNNSDKQGGCVNQYPIVSLSAAIAKGSPLAIIVAVENHGTIREQLRQNGLNEGEDFFCVHADAYRDYILEFQRQYICNLLVFGDCGLTAVSLTDVNHKNLAELLQESLGKEQTKVLAMHGMGMRAFYHILQLQIALGMQPKHLLLEVNLLTFTNKRHLLPRSQHVELLEMIDSLPQCATTEFRDYIEVSKQRYNNFQTDFFVNSASGNKNRISESSLRLYLKMNYMYRLDCEVEGFAYYMKILELLKKKNISATLFVPPVNWKLGEQLLGLDFLSAYEKNLAQVREKTEAAGFKILDLSYALQQSEFCALNTPDETANYAGRSKLCSLITQQVKNV